VYTIPGGDYKNRGRRATRDVVPEGRSRHARRRFPGWGAGVRAKREGRPREAREFLGSRARRAVCVGCDYLPAVNDSANFARIANISGAIALPVSTAGAVALALVFFGAFGLLGFAGASSVALVASGAGVASFSNCFASSEALVYV